MWVGGIKLLFYSSYNALLGTKSLVEASIRRDGDSLFVFPLDYPPIVGIEHESTNIYEWSGQSALPRRNDKTHTLPSGEVEFPMPYPSYGIEFSDGMSGHLSLRIIIRGDDELGIDLVELSVKRIRLVNGPFGLFQLWSRSSHWSEVGSWPGTWFLSTDPNEGQRTVDLVVT
jgi:hypothetical protein